MATTIKIGDDTWKALNQMKEEPGESFDDVVKRLIDENDAMKFMGGELE